MNTRIAIIASEGCLSSSISLPKEMLSAANDFAKVKGLNAFSELLVASSRRFVECAGDIKLKADCSITELGGVDLMILPALWRNPLSALKKQRKLIEQIPEWFEQGTQLCAVGSASFLLAEAGLLDGRAATTHWVQAELFSRRYPLVNYQKDFLITQSERVYCAASVNSLADLTIHFVEQIYGKACAQHVETNFSPEARTPFSASLYDDAQKRTKSDSSDRDIARLIDWLQENISQPHSNASLAKLLKLSERALNRRFQKATKQSPQVWLEATRITHAKSLLKKTQLTISEVAAESGYPDRSYFARRFKKNVGISPVNYRTKLLKKSS